MKHIVLYRAVPRTNASVSLSDPGPKYLHALDIPNISPSCLGPRASPDAQIAGDPAQRCRPDEGERSKLPSSQLQDWPDGRGSGGRGWLHSEGPSAPRRV